MSHNLREELPSAVGPEASKVLQPNVDVVPPGLVPFETSKRLIHDEQPPNEMIGVPKHKLEELGQRLEGLVQENRDVHEANQQLHAHLEMARNQLTFWRQQDCFRYYAGHIMGGIAPSMVHKPVKDREKALDAVCSLANRMAERDDARRPLSERYQPPCEPPASQLDESTPAAAEAENNELPAIAGSIRA